MHLRYIYFPHVLSIHRKEHTSEFSYCCSYPVYPTLFLCILLSGISLRHVLDSPYHTNLTADWPTRWAKCTYIYFSLLIWHHLCIRQPKSSAKSSRTDQEKPNYCIQEPSAPSQGVFGLLNQRLSYLLIGHVEEQVPLRSPHRQAQAVHHVHCCKEKTEQPKLLPTLEPVVQPRRKSPILSAIVELISSCNKSW